MKIDMYTLLGLVKDGKAPKRIKQTTTKMNIFKVDRLNSIVEIPDDEDEEKEIPEKLEYEESDENGEFSINGFTFDFEQKIQIIKTVNEIIDFLKQN